MNIITILAYVFHPTEQKSANDKNFNVMRVRYQQGKNNYIFADVYLSDGQAKYAALAAKDDIIIVCGEINVSAYIGRDNVPKPKVTINAKSLKLLSKQPTIAKQEEPEVWF